MIYSVNITTGTEGEPNKYTKIAPLRTVLKITRGLIYKVELDFPPGSAGLMGIAIADGGFQVWPSTLGSWFTGDGLVISFEDVYLKEAAPFDLLVYSYNEDDTYPHSVNLRIGQLNKEIYMARFLPHLGARYMAEYIAKLQDQQAVIAAEQAEQIIETPFEWLT